MNPKQNIKSLSLQDLQNELKTLGLEGYRASQVKRWLYKFDVDSFAKMTNIAGKFREILKEQFDLLRLPVVKMQLSKDGTKKYLLQLEDGHCVEVVLIPADGRNTLCVSTQVGCGMCCAFCLTGTMGLIRNLTQFEILEQVSAIRRTLAEGERITNLVFMGMGEPLANTASLYPAIDILLDAECFDFSRNHVTVSTCGLANQIESFGDKTQARLAISLNATTDTVRDQIMPINRKCNIKALITACHKMKLPQRSRITIEYVMLGGINDSLDDARRLVRLLNGLRVKINLLPFNENPQMPYKRPSHEKVRAFQQYLMDKGLVAIERKSRGQDISGACGQLVTNTVI
ncbi:MAG: hypothetical protein ACD_62C00033G0003 [uncultured bacterium]|nr:MAG: hypothetical protein ACD_62C00033G0003 [uncultured bacterium]